MIFSFTDVSLCSLPVVNDEAKAKLTAFLQQQFLFSKIEPYLIDNIEEEPLDSLFPVPGLLVLL